MCDIGLHKQPRYQIRGDDGAQDAIQNQAQSRVSSVFRPTLPSGIDAQGV